MNHRKILHVVLLACLPLGAISVPLEAQPADRIAQDTLQLAELQELATRRDPRAAQAALEQHRTDLQRENISTGLLPQFELRSSLSYQSEVTTIPLSQPGVTIARPPKDRSEATLGVQWMVWDGGLARARQDLETSRLSTAVSTLDATLYRVRVEVSEAFFSALLLQEAVRETDALIEDLEARLTEVRARVAAGAALAGDTALLRAEVLRADQQREALRADRSASLDVLALLTDVTVSESTTLSAPALSQQMESLGTVDTTLRVLPESLRLHPQFAVFDAQRDRFDREVGVLGTGRMPVVQAFADLSLGSPGLEQFTTEVHDYWRTGVQIKWAPWDWKRRSRDVESVRVRQRILETEEAAFTESLIRGVQRPQRAIIRLQAALETDEAIISLREQVERQARAQFAERTIPASVYTDARTDLTEARIARLRHSTELARAQAEALMTLGLELR